MANQEPFTFGNGNRAPEQTPHSGIHHDERPVEEFETTLAEDHEMGRIQTPDSPARLATSTSIDHRVPTTSPESWLRRHRRAVAGAVVAAIVTGGGYALARGGESSEPSTKGHSVGAPKETGAPETLTQAQQERANLKPEIPRNSMFTADYFKPGGDVLTNIDRELLYANLDILLNNITYMRETGDFSVMNQTFFQADDGSYPQAEVDVEGIKSIYEGNAQQQEANPNQPVSQLVLTDVEDIKTAGFGTVDVIADVHETIYGNPTNDAVGAPVESTYRTKFTLEMNTVKVVDPATGEATDGEENIFVILHQENMGLVQ